jgi:hypothetical protein
MYRPIVTLVLASCAAAALLAAPGALAQGNPPGTVTVSSAVTGIHQFSADPNQNGDVQWSSAAVSGGVMRQLTPAFAAGLSLRYDHEDWRLGPSAALGGAVPWRRLERPGATLNLSLALSRTFLVGVSPTVEWAYDSRAGAGDAMIYGAVVSAANVFSPRFTLGAGASVTRQFYSLKASPFVILNWKLTDRLRVANAAPAGPLGGAGVELRYAPTPDWELAAGGVVRSDRWRLEEHGATAANVGESSFMPLLTRLSRRLGTKVRVDLCAGVVTNGRIKLKDDDGHELARDDYATAPLVSASLSGRF